MRCVSTNNNMKQRVDQIVVEKKYDFYTIVEKDGKRIKVYNRFVDALEEILKGIDETRYKNGIISTSVLNKNVGIKYPELKTDMLRKTDGYYEKYANPMRVLDYYRFVDYYKDGTVTKNQPLKDKEKKLRGLDDPVIYNGILKPE